MRALPVALYVAALLGALLIGPHGPVYWDSFGYVGQALSGQVGGLALGRPLFVLVSRVLASAFHAGGGSVWALEPFLRIAWLAVAALSAPLTHALARACGLGPRGALAAGLAVAFSPAMAHTSSAVLTDAPSVSLALLAFVLGARAVGEPAGEHGTDARPSLAYAVGAGAALGAAFGLREQAAGQALVLALMLPRAAPGRRLRVALAMSLGFAVLALAPVAYVFATQRGYGQLVAGWLRAMERERAQHPYRPRDLLAYLGWLAALGPVTLLAATLAWMRQWRTLARRGSVMLAVAVPSLLQLLLLAGYQDISFSPRYLLPALPGALAIPAGLLFETAITGSRRRLALGLTLLMLPLVLAAPLVRAKERPLHETIERLPAALARVPTPSVVVTGQPCPAVALFERLARREAEGTGTSPSWERVCPGWGWPSDLAARLDGARAQGRTVVLDLRETSWLGPRQRTALDEARRYAEAHEGAVDVQVWR